MAEPRIESEHELDYPAQVAMAICAEFRRSARYRVHRGAINWGTRQQEITKDKVDVAVILDGVDANPRSALENPLAVGIEAYTRAKGEGLDDVMLSQLRRDLWIVMQRVGTYLRQKDKEKLITRWDAVIQEKFNETAGVMGIEASVEVNF